MNKFKIIGALVAIILVLGLGLYVKKQWFDDGSVFTTSTMNSDSVTRLSAAGGDLRIYEFTPQTSPYMQCIFVAGSDGKGGTFCFEKKDYVANNKNLP